MPTEASPTATTPVRCQIGCAQAAVLGHDGARDARDLLLGHARVGLVLEVEHVAVARALAHGAGERRDRAGVRAGDVRDQAVEVDRLGAEQDERLGSAAARDRRDQRDLVAVLQRAPIARRTPG